MREGVRSAPRKGCALRAQQIYEELLPGFITSVGPYNLLQKYQRRNTDVSQNFSLVRKNMDYYVASLIIN